MVNLSKDKDLKEQPEVYQQLLEWVLQVGKST
jgi:hypothetical protein